MGKLKELPSNTTTVTDLPLAVFLCIKGISLLDIKPLENSNRVSFLFPDTEEVNKFRMEYLNDGLIPARSFYTTFKTLKRRVYEVLGRD